MCILFNECLNYAILAYFIIIYIIFISFAICKTFRAFKITFLKIKQNQELDNTPDFTLNYFFLASEILNLVMKQNFDFYCLKYLPYQVNS